jgi:hypothetical protein
MLLSMYVSYLLANHSKKTHVLIMIVFTPLVAFLSAYFHGSDWYWMFLIMPISPSFYASFLSFPFYVFIDEIYVPGRHWIYFHSIRFLTTDLTFAEWEGYDLVYMMQRNLWEQFLSTFYFFLFVNFLGALLGYLIAKKYRIQFLNDKQGKVFCVSTAIASIIGAFFLGSIARVGVVLFGFAIFLLNIILFKTFVPPIMRTFKEVGERKRLTQVGKIMLIRAFYVLQGLFNLVFGFLELLRHAYEPFFGFSIGFPYVLASCFSFLTAYELSKKHRKKALTWGIASSLLFIILYGYGLLDYRHNLTSLYIFFYGFSSSTLMINVVFIILNGVSMISLPQMSKNND